MRTAVGREEGCLIDVERLACPGYQFSDFQSIPTTYPRIWGIHGLIGTDVSLETSIARFGSDCSLIAVGTNEGLTNTTAFVSRWILNETRRGQIPLKTPLAKADNWCRCTRILEAIAFDPKVLESTVNKTL
jgi:hypothetical protein